MLILCNVIPYSLQYAMTTRNVPETPVDPNISSDSSSTLATSSANSSATSNSSSTSSTAPSSPITNIVGAGQQQPNELIAATATAKTNMLNKEKRHSLNAITAASISINVGSSSSSSNR